MDINYPIFLRDRDGYMYLLDSTSDVQARLEPVDVEDREYEGWDAHGRPVELHLDHGVIGVKALDEATQLDRLRASIVEYARLLGLDESHVPQDEDRNVTELFNAIEQQTGFKGIIGKLKRKFAKRKQET